MILDDRAVQKVLREADDEELAAALKNADVKVQDKVFRNMPKRAAARLKKDMDCMGPVQPKDGEAAQQKIIDLIFRLENAGCIVIQSSQESNIQRIEAVEAKETTELIERIEEAVQKNGRLYLYGKNDLVSKTLAAYENRMEDLRRIRELTLYPDCFEAAQSLLRLDALEELTVYNYSELRDLPESLMACSGLKRLSCRVQSLPEWIGGFASLEKLDLSGSAISALPQSMANLAALKSLNLNSMNLSTLPEWIGGFTSRSLI